MHPSPSPPDLGRLSPCVECRDGLLSIVGNDVGHEAFEVGHELRSCALCGASPKGRVRRVLDDELRELPSGLSEGAFDNRNCHAGTGGVQVIVDHDSRALGNNLGRAELRQTRQ